MSRRPLPALAAAGIAVVAWAALTARADAQTRAPVRDPVTLDLPVRDTANPMALEELHFASGGARLNGLLYLASGKGPHPTVALLHGYPGNERNLDLAQAMRRAGMNVLFFHYRGARYSRPLRRAPPLGKCSSTSAIGLVVSRAGRSSVTGSRTGACGCASAQAADAAASVTSATSVASLTDALRARRRAGRRAASRR